MDRIIKKSPIYYIGNKTKLLKWIISFFPKGETYDTFYDLFGGSGVVGLNIAKPGEKKVYNELRKPISDIYKILDSKCPSDIVVWAEKTMEQWNLTKTNKKAFLEFRQKILDVDKPVFEHSWYYWLLSHFTFSNMLSFKNGKLSKNHTQFGRRVFNEKIVLSKLLDFQQNCSETILSVDYQKVEIKPNSFIYLDPPYLNTDANYMREQGGWKWKEEQQLLDYCIKVHKQGHKFMLSNIDNKHLINWAEKNGFNVEYKDYNHVFNSYQKSQTKVKEILIMNY